MKNNDCNEADAHECAEMQEIRDKLRARFERAVRKREAYEPDTAAHTVLSERMHGYSAAIDMLNDATRKLKMRARKQ